MEGKILTLEKALQNTSKAKCFSWSVLGNSIGCEVPKSFEGKAMEISVLWGVSSKYYVMANLVDGTVDELEASYISLGDFDKLQDLKKHYPALFSARGMLYVM